MTKTKEKDAYTLFKEAFEYAKNYPQKEEDTIKEYEVWSEGWLASGCESQPQPAQRHGVAKGTSFKDACNNLFKEDRYYCERTMTYWACRLFDNEVEARRVFG